MLTQSLPTRPRPFRDRMQGPGGYYNIGNAISLIVGIATPIIASGDVAAIGTFLAGSGSAIALTTATFVFFISGECYHRAWACGAPPDARLNRWGDTLSGMGAIALGIALFMLGQPVLAAFSGLLHALGKFGSAWHGPRRSAAATPDLFRSAVLVSRIPAMIAAMLALLAPQIDSAQMVVTLSLLISYFCWTKADLLLFRS